MESCQTHLQARRKGQSLLVCTWSARKTLMKPNWRPWGYRKFRRWYWQPMAKCLQKKRQWYTSVNWTCSWRQCFLKIHPQFSQLPLDEWPETTSHQERQVKSWQHVQSWTIRRTWFVHEFLFLINFSYIFIAGNCDRHWNSSNKKKWMDERRHISTRKLVPWTNRNRNPNELSLKEKGFSEILKSGMCTKWDKLKELKNNE